MAAVFSTSAPSANAFWGKGFRLLSYVQQAQTAKRFAKGRVCRLLQSAAAAAAAFSPGCLRTPEPSRLGLPSALQRGSASPPRAPPALLSTLLEPLAQSLRFSTPSAIPQLSPQQPRARCVEGERTQVGLSQSPISSEHRRAKNCGSPLGVQILGGFGDLKKRWHLSLLPLQHTLKTTTTTKTNLFILEN